MATPRRLQDRRPARASGGAARPSPSQTQRRAELLDAARLLANKGGYEAVTIDAICRLASVARGTIYNYFSSKDHLLVAAIAQWAEECTTEIRRRPPAGGTLQDRIVGTLGYVADRVMREPKFFRAAFQALSAPDPAASQMQARLQNVTAEYLAPVLGSAPGIDPAPLCMVLGHVTYVSLIGMIAGRLSPEAFIHDLTVVTRMALESSDVRRQQSNEEQAADSARSLGVRAYRVRGIRVTERPPGGACQPGAAGDVRDVDFELIVDTAPDAVHSPRNE